LALRAKCWIWKCSWIWKRSINETDGPPLYYSPETLFELRLEPAPYRFRGILRLFAATLNIASHSFYGVATEEAKIPASEIAMVIREKRFFSDCTGTSSVENSAVT